MKVAVVTRLFAKWDMDVDAGHELRFMIDDKGLMIYDFGFTKVKSYSTKAQKNSSDNQQRITENQQLKNLYFTRSAFCFTKAAQPV